MADEGLPPKVKEFIEGYILSVEQLEILILISKNPGKEFTVESVYSIILSTTASVEAWLKSFVEADLAKQVPENPAAFRFNSGSPQQPVIEELAKTYKAMPVRVIEAIYNKERMRGPHGIDPAHGFANAFKLRKE